MEIQYLENREIDKLKWDATINASKQGTVYALSLYLDAVCDIWDALVVGDYDVIMPLPIRYRLGFKLLYTPLFIQQLGIFSALTVSSQTINKFITEASSRFSNIDYALHLNDIDAVPAQFTLTKRNNFVLDISRPYEIIAQGYSKDARRSLKHDTGIYCKIEQDFDFVISNFLSFYQEKIIANPECFERFRAAIKQAHSNDQLINYSVYRDNERIAAALFFVANQTAFYVLGAPTTEGKKQNATHFLIDGFIRQFAGKLQKLDFEGSDIESVAYFYQKWGSANEPYYIITVEKTGILRIARKIVSVFKGLKKIIKPRSK